MDRRTLTRSMLAATATGIALPGIALRAQTPSASPSVSSGIRLAEIPGVPIALSPDGTMLAGTLDRERICIWDTETFETVARSEPVQEISIIDETSIAWSPDSTALAWSLDAARLFRDSDIYVFDIDNGQITNLTDDEPMDEDAAKLVITGEIDSPMDVDFYPSWSADGESILFARMVWEDAPELATSLWRIPRNGGEATEVAVLAPDAPFLASSIRAGQEDGSVIYSTWPVDPDSPHHGVFMVTPDGEVEGISTGMLARATRNMILMSVAPIARKASLVSTYNYSILDNSGGPVWIEMDLDSGIPTAFEEVLSLPIDYQEAIDQDMILLGAPAFLTDGDGQLTGYLYATTNADYDTFTLWRHDTASGEAESLGTIHPDEAELRNARHYDRIEAGSNGTAAIFHRGNAWLTSVEA